MVLSHIDLGMTIAYKEILSGSGMKGRTSKYNMKIYWPSEGPIWNSAKVADHKEIPILLRTGDWVPSFDRVLLAIY